MKKSPLIAICTGLAVFAFVFFIKMLITRVMPSITVFARQVWLEILLGAVSVITARLIFHIPFSAFSIIKGFSKKTAYKYMLRALALGMVATLTLLAFSAPPMPMMKSLAPFQLLIILFTASISEELLSRGLVQGMVKDGKAIVIVGRLHIAPAVIAGATVFSLIHFSIYITGGSYVTTIIIMAYAFLLGSIAGKAREQSNLGGAILTHMFFNIGGTVAGIIVNIISISLTGHFIR